MAKEIDIWACAALCADGSEREVTGIYEGDTCVLLSRPWRAPSSLPTIVLTQRKFFHVLSALIGAADYHCHQGVWYGELAINWRLFSILTNLGQSTVYAALKALANDRYIHYVPGTGSSDATLVRVFPNNASNGVRIFQVDASWMPGFELQVIAKRKMFHVKNESKFVELIQDYNDIAIPDIGAIVSSAPVKISPRSFPKLWGSCEQDKKVDYFLDKIKGVPGLDDLYRLHAGIDPDIGETASLEIREAASEGGEAWRDDAFSQGGMEIKISAENNYELTPADVGVLSSWAIAEKSVEKEDGSQLPQTLGKTPNSSQESAETGDIEIGLPQTLGKPGQQRGPRDPIKYIYYVGGASPKSGEDIPQACASGPATAAPPPAAPPGASLRFMRTKSDRQLRQEQVDAIYRRRGERVNTARRKRMTSKEVSCIETYERLSGVPFCAEDLPWLSKALTRTSHALVLRGIKDCCRFPVENPGRYVYRDGMKHIWNDIEKNSMLHAKARGSKKVTPVGSSRSAALDAEIKRRREALETSPRKNGTTSQAVVVSQAAVAPAPAPSTKEPKGQPA